MKLLKNLSVSFILMPGLAFAATPGYVAVNAPAKVFDEPNAKGYVTLNQKNEEVTLLPGMAFKVMEKANGWYVIEYSPGLRGYLSEQTEAKTIKAPTPGTFSISNDKTKKLKADNSTGKWTATVDGKSYNGVSDGDIVVFLNDKKEPVYSLVDIGKGPVVMTYDNKVTKFF